MALDEKTAQEVGQDEETRWCETHEAILSETRRSRTDFHRDRKLARALTAEIVASRRDEDKAALASDEAVAHGLTSLRKKQSEGLEGLLEQPYFARVVTHEKDREVEFRLGTESFPDQRIVDWRKAPISRLYYDYKEGDEFSETIQGMDREGFIKLRRAYQGKQEVLNVIETAQGTIYRQPAPAGDGDAPSVWKVGRGSDHLSRAPGHDGHLPPILSLITTDQFDLITRDPDKPIIIQGIAGSGKTTVALHRLAWLLHEDNRPKGPKAPGPARPEKCLVVMFNRSLKAYIETTLPELKIQNVPIRTFHQWAHQIVTELVGPRPQGVFKKSRELEQFKSSSTCLESLHRYVESTPPEERKNFLPSLFGFFRSLSRQELYWPKWSEIRTQLQDQVEKGVCEFQDDPLLLHLIYAEHGYYPAKSAASLGLCDHIVIDEAQDFGLVEIRALLNAVDRHRTVTIVGDIAQKIVMGRNFSSWEEMLGDAGFEQTSPIRLTVSHRSTQEIMELAMRLRQDPSDGSPASSGGNPLPPAKRHGPSPTYIAAGRPEVLAHFVGQWIRQRTDENPHALSAVICRWPKEAQRLVDELRKIGFPSVRLGHRDQFDFSPGVTVTNIHQVKGLEFRNVLMVEPSEENYRSSSEEERNLLYVGVTRAELRLDFIGCQPPSKMLRKWLS